MRFNQLKLPGAYEIELTPRGDHRGRLTRLFCAEEMRAIGLDKPIVNVNHSMTMKRGTIRGMHFQYPPDSEIKIVKCLRGAIWDCIVDLRQGSPTFLQWTALLLSAENDRMIYVPEGFAHGFQALDDNVETVYFITNFFAPANEGGVRFDDPAVGVSWPEPPTEISDRDKSHPAIDRNFNGIAVPLRDGSPGI